MSALLGFAVGCVVYQLFLADKPNWVDALTVWIFLSGGWFSCWLIEVRK